ncbi:MAG: N-acetylglucosamine-specific PTS transporter subunit IIBC [Elusimicrobiota bacterium]|jgi:PTS system N-acetylglucosamine-specific IIC component|nr:N-acetylglucosamine-specific PTS transporter subunit IIBC [Elusimicrobiota bacterium]
MKEHVSKLGNILVKLGKSLMLPIAILPIAGLLLRLGQNDMLNIAFMAEAGNAVFNNLPVIFALGVAIGFAKESHGAAALSAYVGYVVMTSGMKVLNPDLGMGVFGGIIIGVTAGGLYNKYKDISLPSYLAFFGGRRFVPIITGFVAIFYALIFNYVWPPAQDMISRFGNWVISSGEIGLFSWGFANRLLLPLGLHHILNTLVYFQFGDYSVVEAGVTVVKHGDLWRFFAGDPSAGSFMAGFVPVMMFGLPAAALAMVSEAYKQNRKAAAGILLSAALTSFLTGITEPIEFAFMFLAFPLYVLHAVLSGISMVIMSLLHVRAGYMFSAGLFDYILSHNIGQNAWLVVPVGLAYGVLYFFVFKFAIRFWNLKTPGREDDSKTTVAPDAAPVCAKPEGGRAAAYLRGLGGAENIKTLEACATRLRVEINDNCKIDETALKAAGARAVVNNIKGSAQVIIGPEADLIGDEIKKIMPAAGSREK